MCENWEDVIVYSDEFSYYYYKKLVNKYLENDWREINFQNRIVIPFLDKLFINTIGLSIVDVSMQYKNKDSEIHDPYKYSSKDAAPPDLLIAYNWNYANKNNDEIKYLAAIEVKSTYLDPIYNIDKYKNQVESHLEANPKVILTDCIRWQFFDSESGFNPIRTIDLFDENNEWKKKIEENSIFLIEEVPFDFTRIQMLT